MGTTRKKVTHTQAPRPSEPSEPQPAPAPEPAPATATLPKPHPPPPPRPTPKVSALDAIADRAQLGVVRGRPPRDSVKVTPENVVGLMKLLYPRRFRELERYLED